MHGILNVTVTERANYDTSGNYVHTHTHTRTHILCFFGINKVAVCMPNTSTEAACLNVIFTATWKMVPVCRTGQYHHKQSTAHTTTINTTTILLTKVAHLAPYFSIGHHVLVQMCMLLLWFTNIVAETCENHNHQQCLHKDGHNYRNCKIYFIASARHNEAVKC